MNWKEKLYEQYVTSGQARLDLSQNVTEPDNLFRKSRPYVIRIIERYIPPNRDLTIIDLGCGSGRFLYYLNQKGYFNIWGVDISAEQVEIARRLGTFKVAHDDLLSFLSKSNLKADVILLMDVIEHFNMSEIFSLLDEINKKIKIGGRLIIHVPNASGIFGTHIRYGDLTHETAFTTSSIKQLLSVFGYKKIKFYEDKPIPSKLTGFIRLILWELFTFPFRLLYLAESGSKNIILSQNLLVVATK